MKRGHLICIYFILYVTVWVTLGLKLVTFEIAKSELSRIDMAINIAGEKTAKVLNDHVYEEDPMRLLRETFVHTYSLCMNQKEEYEMQENYGIIQKIYIGINGQLSENGTELMSVTDEDEIAVYIVFNDFTIVTPFRTFVISREYYKEADRHEGKR